MPELFGITVLVAMFSVAGPALVAAASRRVVREYERGVLFRFGRVSPENVIAAEGRYLRTLVENGVEQNTTVVFPLPIDLLTGLQKAALSPT